MANTTADKLAKLEATKSALKAAINGSGSTVGDKFADYPPAVTNGRSGIAAAITEKGVQTGADAPFDVLEANVRAIETGGATESCIATLTGAMFSYVKSDGTVVKKDSIDGEKEVMKNSIAYITKRRPPASGTFTGETEDINVYTDPAGAKIGTIVVRGNFQAVYE